MDRGLAQHETGHAVFGILSAEANVITVSDHEDDEGPYALTHIMNAADGEVEHVDGPAITLAGSVFSLMLDERFDNLPLEQRLFLAPGALEICEALEIAEADKAAFDAEPCSKVQRIIATRVAALLALWCGNTIADGLLANSQAGVPSALAPLRVIVPMSQQGVKFENMARDNKQWETAESRTALAEHAQSLPPLDISDLFMADAARVVS